MAHATETSTLLIKNKTFNPIQWLLQFERAYREAQQLKSTEDHHLDDMGIKPGTLAKAIDVDRTAIKKIVEGKRAITADMALRLGLFSNMRAGFWLNLQRDYELRLA